MTPESTVLAPRPLEAESAPPTPQPPTTPGGHADQDKADQDRTDQDRADLDRTSQDQADRDRTDRPTRTFGNLELRPDEMQALVAGTRVGLTVREFQLLAVLADREDRVVRRPEIYRQVWGGEMKHRDRAVDVFVRKVRTKLAAVAPEWAYIHTHFGIGYRFAPESVTGEPEPPGLGATQRTAVSAQA
jgi:DNA-binding winged helix-turn-helix (wHTH) protein